MANFISAILTLLFGLLLTWAVNHAHWADLWETRHRLKDLARRRAEAERLDVDDEEHDQSEDSGKASHLSRSSLFGWEPYTTIIAHFIPFCQIGNLC